MAKKHKLILVTREDLVLSDGKLVSQVSHAVADLMLRVGTTSPKFWEIFEQWNKTGKRIVSLSVDDEKELLEIYNKCIKEDVPHCLIRDAGLTEVPPGTFTCLGIGPVTEQMSKDITGRLRLK